ncbi:MAG TPA: NifB/NifX family molybdenum-iron cluster-binding protein, partial [Candidatus Dormibacteraeota bacterium]|nr:NifB/NifX family molybdenum-iron cluster-binding protein [Candidatus Dormibacteraeota bacterium]
PPPGAPPLAPPPADARANDRASVLPVGSAATRTSRDFGRAAADRVHPRTSSRQREEVPMIVCVPVNVDGTVDPRWGRAARVAVAQVDGGSIEAWQEVDVRWDEAHEQSTEGGHHARIARFLLERHVEAIVAGHMGEGMLLMLQGLGIRLELGAAGDARRAVEAFAAREATS